MLLALRLEDFKNGSHTPESASQLLSIVQDLLERVDTPATALPSLIAAIAACASNFPGVFATKHQDIVDLLIGWALAPGEPWHGNYCRTIFWCIPC